MSDPAATLGGILIATRNVPRLLSWYRDLGLPLGEDGTCVLGGNGTGMAAAATGIVFSIMPANGELGQTGGDVALEPYGRQRMTLNLRVQDLASLAAALRARDVQVAGPKDYGYGTFAWTKDPDGNLVELWQPAAEAPQPSPPA